MTLSFGDAELPFPLRRVGINLRGNGLVYSANAYITVGRQINSDRLSKELADRIPEGYAWKVIRAKQDGAYIYDGERTPAIAFCAVKINQSRQPTFMFFMGANGARTRRIGSEEEFEVEMASFEDITSYFINACLALRGKTKTSARKIELPSSLELSCLNATYSS